MIVYIFLLIGCLGAGLILKDDNKKNKIISVICTGIILILISSIRSINVGVDTLQYATVFEKIANCNSLTEAFNVSRFEKGFIVLCFILSRISSNPQILIFVSSVIIISSVMIFLYSSSKKVWLSLFMFIALNYFSMYMNVMRQAVAISIIFIAFYIIFEKKQNNFIFNLYVFCKFVSYVSIDNAVYANIYENKI